MHPFRYILCLIVIVAVVESSYASDPLVVDGVYDTRQKKISLSGALRGKDVFQMNIDQSSEEETQLRVNIKHLKIHRFDISTELKGILEFFRDDEGGFIALNGKVTSQYTLINYKPTRDISGNFSIRNDTLYIHSLSFGEITCKGSVALTQPYALDLAFHIHSMYLGDFLSFWVDDQEMKSAGEVAGFIQITGTFDKPQMKSHLETYNGFIEDFSFDSMVLNFDGIYPVVTVVDSVIAQSDGLTFKPEGVIDLKKTDDMLKQIDELKKSPVVNVDSEGTEWTLRRVQKSEDTGATELKYQLRKNEDAPDSFEEESGLLGVERVVEF